MTTLSMYLATPDEAFPRANEPRFSVQLEMWHRVIDQFVRMAEHRGERLVVIGEVGHQLGPTGHTMVQYRGETLP
jgi:hypothetical protein